MLNRKPERVWALVLIAAVVLTGCGGRSSPAATPQLSAPAATASPQSADAPPDAGGVTADEPTSAPPTAPIPTTVPTATARPSPTAIPQTPTPTPAPPTATPAPTATLPSQDPYPLQIEVMRQQSYPGSAITIEQTLAAGSNYSRYVVSYLSDGYKIYALMTVPDGPKPATGWPAIIFNHGYIRPRNTGPPNVMSPTRMPSHAAATSSSSPTIAATAARKDRPRALTATPATQMMCSTRWLR